jgi:hypothetical protein
MTADTNCRRRRVIPPPPVRARDDAAPVRDDGVVRDVGVVIVAGGSGSRGR